MIDSECNETLRYVISTWKAFTVNTSFCGNRKVATVLTTNDPIGTPPKSTANPVNVPVSGNGSGVSTATPNTETETGVSITTPVVVAVVIVAIICSSVQSRKFMRAYFSLPLVPCVLFFASGVLIAVWMAILIFCKKWQRRSPVTMFLCMWWFSLLTTYMFIPFVGMFDRFIPFFLSDQELENARRAFDFPNTFSGV